MRHQGVIHNSFLFIGGFYRQAVAFLIMWVPLSSSLLVSVVRIGGIGVYVVAKNKLIFHFCCGFYTQPYKISLLIW